jgi:hypothetical protein
MRASEPVSFVIPSEARNLASGALIQYVERFFVVCATTQDDNALDVAQNARGKRKPENRS